MGPDGAPEGVLVFAQDVTARETEKRTHADLIAQLQEQDRYKDEFISVVSHELRTPLNFILGFASVLEDEVAGPLNDDQRGQVGKILFGADRMLGLVNDLLDFAKLQAGKFAILPEVTEVAPLIHEAVAPLEPLAAAKGIALEVAVGADRPVELDLRRIEQVLVNLVSNAIKFTDPDGRVRVEATCDGAELVVTVADTGRGIPAEAMPHLFQRFRQVDMSATREHGGTGLGLAIAKGLVEAHGGRIEATSALGEGSTFRFVVPVAQPDGALSVAP
jgi:signal transduction histidine kinase